MSRKITLLHLPFSVAKTCDCLLLLLIDCLILQRWLRIAVLLVTPNRFYKGCRLQFYIFPHDLTRRSKWIAAIKKESWEPSEHSWVCSDYFVSSLKSDDPLSPDYIPSIFKNVTSPLKGKVQLQLEGYEKRKPTQNIAEQQMFQQLNFCKLSQSLVLMEALLTHTPKQAVSV